MADLIRIWPRLWKSPEPDVQDGDAHSLRDATSDTRVMASDGQPAVKPGVIDWAHSVFRRSLAPLEWLASVARDRRVRELGGIFMIFRRENRGESFQRQISNLRQQSVDQDEEQEVRDRERDHEREREYDYDEPTDTGRFSPEPSAQPDTGSFTAVRPVEPDSQAPSAPAATAYQQQPRWQSADSSTSVIAANSHWNGTLRSEGGLNVLGRADGELHASGDLFVAEGAEVDAELHADSVIVAGLVRGRIIAGVRLEVLPQGQVTGDVKAPKLVVHEGASITGQLRMQGGDSGTTYSRPNRSTTGAED